MVSLSARSARWTWRCWMLDWMPRSAPTVIGWLQFGVWGSANSPQSLIVNTRPSGVLVVDGVDVRVVVDWVGMWVVPEWLRTRQWASCQLIAIARAWRLGSIRAGACAREVRVGFHVLRVSRVSLVVGPREWLRYAKRTHRPIHVLRPGSRRRTQHLDQRILRQVHGGALQAIQVGRRVHGPQPIARRCGSAPHHGQAG